MKRIFSPATGSLLLLALSVQVGLAQEPKPTALPFPLPTREMRLVEETQQPQTSVNRLLELMENKDRGVRAAALRALGERGDESILPTLEKVLYLSQYVFDGDVAMAMKRIRTRWNLLPVEDPKPHLDWIVESLQAGPVSVQNYGDYEKVRRFTYSLLELAEANDKRALPFIEKYLAVVRNGTFGNCNLIDNDIVIHERNHRLGEAYWKLKLQGMTLQQKVADFKRVGSNPNAAPVSFYAMEGALIEEGTSIVPLLATIIQEEKTPPHLQWVAWAVLRQIRDPKTTATLRRLVDAPTGR